MHKKEGIVIFAILLLGILFLAGCAVGKAGAAKQAATCTDTDGGKNYAVAGTVQTYSANVGNTTKADYCKNETIGFKEQLMEAYCAGKKGTAPPGIYDSFSCASIGQVCKDGACVGSQTNTCTDTDGGKEYTKKGTVTLTNNTGSSTHEDWCNGNEIVIETYCDGTNYLSSGYVYCKDIGASFTCKDGACISNQTNTSNTTGKVTDITGYTDPDQGNITFTAATEGTVTSVKFQVNCNLGFWQDIGTDSSAPFQATYAGGPACDAMRVQATAMPSGANYVEGPFKYLG